MEAIAWETTPLLTTVRPMVTIMNGHDFISYVPGDLNPPAPEGGHPPVPVSMGPEHSSYTQAPPRRMERLDTNVLGHMLTQPQVERALAHTGYANLSIEFFHFLHTEADVIRALHLYIVNPVNQILENVLRDPLIQCRSEVVIKRANGRFDMVWRVDDKTGLVNIATGERKPREILVLELKTRGTIKLNDFEGALDAQANGSMTQQGVNLSKQAHKYGRRAPIVVMFDWVNMAVYDYQPGQPTRDRATGNRTIPARYTTTRKAEFAFTDGSGSSAANEVPNITHRKMLLCALLYSFYKLGYLK